MLSIVFLSVCCPLSQTEHFVQQGKWKSTPLSKETLEKGGALKTLTVQFYVKCWFHQTGRALALRLTCDKQEMPGSSVPAFFFLVLQPKRLALDMLRHSFTPMFPKTTSHNQCFVKACWLKCSFFAQVVNVCFHSPIDSRCLSQSTNVCAVKNNDRVLPSGGSGQIRALKH